MSSIRRISAKRLARLGGRIPSSTIAPNTGKKPPMRQIVDPASERGAREIVDSAEIIRRLSAKIIEQNGMCGLCWEPLPDDISRIAPDHINPRGMDGAWRDDHPSNLQATHVKCNLDKGSRRVEDVLLLIGPYLLYVEGLECFCGKQKQANRPTCLECWPQLSGQLQHDLNTLKGRDHAAALVEAKRVICSESAA